MTTNPHTLPQDEALRQLAEAEAAVAAAPGDAKALITLGQALYELYRLEEAVTVIQRALDAGTSTYVLGRLAMALSLLDRHEEAVAAAERFRELYPDDAKAQSVAGHVLANAWVHDGALEAFDRALELDPRDGVAHRERARVLKDTERFEEAIDAYQATFEVDPAAWIARVELASLYHEIGKRTEEADVLSEALRMFPNEAGVHHAVGAAQWRYRNYGDAVRAWSEAVRLDPEDFSSHERLAQAFHILGDVARAREQLEILRRLEPEVAAEVEARMRKA